jgi:hypothetical protein
MVHKRRDARFEANGPATLLALGALVVERVRF